MGNEMPSYYAIIPANVRYDKNLPHGAKLLYGEITCLTHKEGYCYAQNAYFSELYGVTPQCISQWVKKLEAGGYISVIYIYSGKEITQRQIRLNVEVPKVKQEKPKNNFRPLKSILDPSKNEFKDNNTRDNNTRDFKQTCASASESKNSEVDEPPTPEAVYNEYHENKYDVSPERFWELNNDKKWKNGLFMHWREAYNKMTPFPDEAYNPKLKFRKEAYKPYSGPLKLNE